MTGRVRSGGEKNDLRCLQQPIEVGEHRPVIDRRYPLEGVVEAYRYVHSGQKTPTSCLR
ncbi:MAG: zinc-binding dehydrogenase [Actinomycetota bacterium]|nr:zinc-binding dehydrogenase [Actinomycetota bacterium]